jgi:Mrp family chromosome partitioning ATPase
MARDCGARLGEIGKKHDGVDAPIPQNSAIVPSAIYAERVSAAAEQINNFKSGIFRACDLDGQPVPERVWHVHDLIPANTVTLLSGDGGTGKSLCALQLAVSTALQRPWLGLAVRHGKAVYLSAEDDKADLPLQVTG